jgi:hypothetical protein
MLKKFALMMLLAVVVTGCVSAKSVDKGGTAVGGDVPAEEPVTLT